MPRGVLETSLRNSESVPHASRPDNEIVFWPLIEIKSAPGIVEGDAGTWSWHRDGKIFSYDNPLLLANRKAKKLKSLLGRQKAMQKVRQPFLEAHVFLSHEAADCRLPEYLRGNVHVRDRAAAAADHLHGLTAVASLKHHRRRGAPHRCRDISTV